ncbi:hypothetical protein [Nonomuraea sp. 10N515B]|uniref:hypothetical protein n=1 Tax=Nonomuraea sp. 10N515B TaxID=3457422 RepID=UPI003FCD7243
MDAGVDAGVDAVLSTPRPFLRQELDKLAGLARTRTPSWAWGLGGSQVHQRFGGRRPRS